MRILPFERPLDELTDEEFFAVETAEELLQKKMFDRLAKFLLNPKLDRCDIADGILADAELIQYLGRFKNVMLETTAPVGSSWEEIQGDKLSYGSITIESDEPSATLALPLLLGCLLDEGRRPWHQASPQEFIPAYDDVQTSNLCGEPAFYAGMGGSMSTPSISAKEKFSNGVLQCFGVC